MALHITASSATLERLRTVKFGAYASVHDIAAAEQQITKTVADDKVEPFTQADWRANISRKIGNAPYKIFVHDSATTYCVIPNFARLRKLDLILSEEIYTEDGVAQLPLSHSIMNSTGTKYISFTGPFMMEDSLLAPITRYLSGTAVKDGVKIWQRVKTRSNRYTNMAYKADAPFPNQKNKFTIAAGELAVQPYVTGFSGTIPFIYKGKWLVGDNVDNDQPFDDSNPLLVDTYPDGKVFKYRIFPDDYAILLGDATHARRLRGVELRDYINPRGKQPYIGRTAVGYDAENDWLIVVVFANGGNNYKRKFHFYEWQYAFYTNGITDAVFTDGSSSVFLYEKFAPGKGRWLIDSLLYPGLHTFIKNGYWLAMAAKAFIA